MNLYPQIANMEAASMNVVFTKKCSFVLLIKWIKKLYKKNYFENKRDPANDAQITKFEEIYFVEAMIFSPKKRLAWSISNRVKMIVSNNILSSSKWLVNDEISYLNSI